MGSKIRIPTLLGLGILVIGLVSGIFLTTARQSAVFQTRASVSANPKNITVTNISDSSVSIYWQTDEEAPGFIQAGTSSSLDLTFKDDRDPGSPKKHSLHFVTLSGLVPNTTYYFKVNSGSIVYPSGNPSTFQTASSATTSKLQPLVGTVLDSQMQPVGEALIVLNIPGAQNLATITKVAGNFILPLKEVRNLNLSPLDLPQAGSVATLNIFNLQGRSHVSLQLPPSSQILQPITLGQDLDLVPPPASPAATQARYDLNHDGVINSLDLSTLLQNFGKNPKNKQADLNGDGTVDQKDIDLLNKFIPRITPQ